MTTAAQAVPVAATEPPPVSPETLAEARRAVASMLSQSESFRMLDQETREKVAGDTARIAAVLAEPEAQAQQTAAAMAGPAPGQFVAQGAQQGAQVAGAFLAAVNFPNFVSSLVEGVFHAIVHSSIEQMKAYGELVANVAKSLNEFRDENVSENQGRDHLVQQFPDAFRIEVDTADDGTRQPRVRVRDGVDEQTALNRINGSMPLDKPLTSLDDDTAEGQLVPAARTQLATSRQQLLATMVLMGINRIVVKDGKIQAKVLYDFQARDNFHFQNSATRFDYGDQYKYAGTGESESKYDGGETSGKEGTESYDKRDANWYSKGKYSYQAEPVLKLVSATQQTADASLTTKASLAGNVDINFASDFLPLEKMADSFQIANIQNASQPRRPGAAPATAQPAPASAQPASTPPAAGQPTTQQPAAR
jgi:hypothetical protein